MKKKDSRFSLFPSVILFLFVLSSFPSQEGRAFLLSSFLRFGLLFCFFSSRVYRWQKYHQAFSLALFFLLLSSFPCLFLEIPLSLCLLPLMESSSFLLGFDKMSVTSVSFSLAPLLSSFIASFFASRAASRGRQRELERELTEGGRSRDRETEIGRYPRKT